MTDSEDPFRAGDGAAAHEVAATPGHNPLNEGNAVVGEPVFGGAESSTSPSTPRSEFRSPDAGGEILHDSGATSGSTNALSSTDAAAAPTSVTVVQAVIPSRVVPVTAHVGSGAELTMALSVWEGPASESCTGASTLIAVPGFGHTAATWGPLAQHLLAELPDEFCRIVGLDLPNRGASPPLPDTVASGELTLGDYRDLLKGTLQQLSTLGLQGQRIVGHSMGGLLLSLAQDQLRGAGSSLRVEYGLEKVSLLAPVPPAAVQWAFADTLLPAELAPPGFPQTLLPLTPATAGLFPFMNVPADGDLSRADVTIPSAFWPAVFFQTTLPSPSTSFGVEPLAGQDWAAATEPFSVALALGAPASSESNPGREVSREAFAPSTPPCEFQVIALARDSVVYLEEARNTYQWLSGDSGDSCFTAIDLPTAHHDLHLTEPRVLLLNASL